MLPGFNTGRYEFGVPLSEKYSYAPVNVPAPPIVGSVDAGNEHGEDARAQIVRKEPPVLLTTMRGELLSVDVVDTVNCTIAIPPTATGTISR